MTNWNLHRAGQRLRRIRNATGRLPIESVIGLETPRLLAIALLSLFCFLAGVFARTPCVRKIVNRLETALLSNMPGYEFIKTMSENFLAADKEHVCRVVLARIEDSWQLGFLIERLEGGLFAVFVRDIPSPGPAPCIS